jgi:hypothetical protein
MVYAVYWPCKRFLMLRYLRSPGPNVAVRSAKAKRWWRSRVEWPETTPEQSFRGAKVELVDQLRTRVSFIIKYVSDHILPRIRRPAHRQV